MKITWNTNVNAPCCPGEIVCGDGRTLLIQTDWDFPAIASTFGWSLRSVQKCNECQSIANGPVHCGDGGVIHCPECDHCSEANVCDHNRTDGTVNCACGVTAGDFISAAREWLENNDGATVEDPGYFE